MRHAAAAGLQPIDRAAPAPREPEAQRLETAFLRSVLALSNDCIKVLDLDGRLLFMSDAGQRLMEVRDFDAIRGCPWPAFWIDEGHGRAEEAVRMARGGGVGRFQAPALTAAGTPKFWDVQVTPILGEDGAPERLLSVSRDITASRDAEDALREAQTLNSLILSSSRDCTVVLDLEGTTQFVSPGGVESMEISDVAAILGLSWLRVWSGPDHAAACAAVAQARAGGVGRFQGFCPTHKGTPKWWDVVVSPLLGSDGRPERLVSIGRDITEQKRTERAREGAEQRLRELNDTLEQQVEARTAERDKLWEISEDLLVLADYEGKLIRLSPSWTRLLGHSVESLLAGVYETIIHPDDFPAVMSALLEMRATGRPGRFEDRLLAADGSWKRIAWTLSPEPGGQRLTGVGHDVTEQREVEERLRQSQKMEAVGQLTGGIAHDFNNLLTGISGSLEMLQTRVAQGRLDTIERYVTAAQASARRAAALTHRLLAFSRRQTLDARATDVGRLVGEMEDLIRRTVGPQIEIEVTLQRDLWPTLVDPNQLENALLNLCINARDAMPDGGRITIVTAQASLDEAAAAAWELAPGDYVTLTVHDDGVGMTPEVVARAFDPFFTTKPMGEGTGLGLSMIYGFVRQSGGQVQIDSRVGRGTTMRLALPRALTSSDVESSVGRASELTAKGAGEVVLVVDDEATIRALIVEALSECGYVAVEACDGASGLAVLQSAARIDLLITDVGLPGGMNGRQMADAARLARPDLAVLFITGYAENAAVGGGGLDSLTQVLTKPFAMDALTRRVRTMASPSDLRGADRASTTPLG